MSYAGTTPRFGAVAFAGPTAPVRRRSLDGVLLGTTLLLCLVGVLMVYSSSAILAQSENRPETAYLRSQIEKVVLGLTGLLVLAHLPYRRLSGKTAGGILGGCVVLLLLLLLPLGLAIEVRGTRRFLDLGILSIQPAEFARLGLVVFLADYIARKEEWMMRSWRGLVVPLCAIGLVGGLIVLQPNLSSAALAGSLGASLLFLGGQPLRRLVVLATPLVLFAAATLRGYQIQRFLWFWRSLFDGDAALPYQVKQSLVALGSGGFLGQGIGQGLQKYFYLPFPHTDFILGVVGEEAGFLGVLALFTLHGVVIARGLRIARLAPDRFSQLTAAGLTLSIAVNFLLHSIVGLGLGPVTGVPLPFVSHGGSALLANALAVGVLLSISRHCRSERRTDPTAWRIAGSRSRLD